jgi:hypothetical protein
MFELTMVVCGKHANVRLHKSIHTMKQMDQSCPRNIANFLVDNQTKCNMVFDSYRMILAPSACLQRKKSYKQQSLLRSFVG